MLEAENKKLYGQTIEKVLALYEVEAKEREERMRRIFKNIEDNPGEGKLVTFNRLQR
jgi:hypothetical protein